MKKFCHPHRRDDIWGAVLALGLGLALLTGCKKSAIILPPPDVETVEIIRQDAPVSEEWVGRLDGFVNADIRAQVSGYLLSRDYKEGELVKKGDPLFQMDAREYQAALDEATAKYDKTEMDVKRYTPLAADNAISKQELDDAVQANLAAKAQVDKARVDLEFTTIVAPIDGTVGFAKAQVGDLVGPASGVLTTISTVDPIKVYFSPSEQAYLDFRRRYPDLATRREHFLEMRFELILDDGTTYSETGTWYAIDRQVNPSTGTIQITAVFPNPQILLRPGQFARVRLVEVQHDTLLVPQQAVIELQGAFQVAVVSADNTAHIRPVQVGKRVGSQWIITDGVKPGERVVVEGTMKVHDGTTVNPKPFHPDAHGAAATAVP